MQDNHIVVFKTAKEAANYLVMTYGNKRDKVGTLSDTTLISTFRPRKRVPWVPFFLDLGKPHPDTELSRGLEWRVVDKNEPFNRELVDRLIEKEEEAKAKPAKEALELKAR